MSKFIEDLYELHLKTSTFPFGEPNKEAWDEEWRLYQYFYEHLSKEDRQLFLRYVNMVNERQKTEMQEIYHYGFKTAIQIFVESLKE